MEPGTLQTTIWRHVACWISKATSAQSHACARAPTHIHVCTHTHTHEPMLVHIHKLSVLFGATQSARIFEGVSLLCLGQLTGFLEPSRKVLGSTFLQNAGNQLSGCTVS